MNAIFFQQFNNSPLVVILIICFILYSIALIYYGVSKSRIIRKLFEAHLHEGYMMVAEDIEVPHLLSVFFGMKLYRVTYNSFYKYAKRYIRSNLCMLYNAKERNTYDTSIAFKKVKSKIVFFAIDSTGSDFSRFVVKGTEYCDERFLKWFDTMVRLTTKNI